MSAPKLSILIPTYNRAHLLDECIRHARTAPQDCEIVVVDNASTDNTVEVARAHASQDARIRHVRNAENIGMLRNFNRAMAEARGEYLCVVCDDDLLLPGNFDKKIPILDRNPEVGFVYSPWHLIDAQGTSHGAPLGSGMLTYPYIGGRDEFGDLLQNNHIMMNAVVFRRALLERLGGMDETPDIHPSTDWEMWLRYAYDGPTAYIPEPLVCVRHHEESATTANGGVDERLAKARIAIWRKWLVEKEPPIVLNENVWERMHALFDRDLRFWFHGDAALTESYLRQLAEIRKTNRRNIVARFEARLADSGAAEKPVPNLPIKWAAPVFDFSGYARLSRETLRTLSARTDALAIEPSQPNEKFIAHLNTRPQEIATWQRLIDNRVSNGAYVCFHVPALWDGSDYFAAHRAANPGFDRYVGISMFETDRLPASWVSACNGMDEVWVPSAFNRETFERSGVQADKLQVIPFGIDASLYDPAKVEPLKISGKLGFTFLSVFQWTKRKGWDVLIKAYLESFTAKDDVCLVLRTHPDRVQTPIQERVDDYIRQLGYDPKQAPPIIVLDDFLSEEEMPALYAAADCFVLPTRGEGWGIPFMEAMAAGLPTIGTRWSAHLDFMKDKNSYLIDVADLVPVDPEQAADNPFYTVDQRWAEPSAAHTAALMREVYEKRDEAKKRGDRARKEIVKNWKPERTAEWIVERIPQIAKKAPRSNGSHAVITSGTNRSRQSAPISWAAPLFDPSGYADEARHFLFALEQAGYHVAAEEVRWSDRIAVLPAKDEQLLLAMTGRQPRAGGIHVSHILPPHFARRAEADVNVGRTMFETDRLPESWVDACNRMDRIWVPSEFNRETFARAGVAENKLAVVPGAIDLTPYDPSVAPLQIDGARGFNFLSVFDWTLRKGWDVLLRAYLEEFEPDEDVALIIKTHSSMGYTLERIVGMVSEYIEETLGRSADRTPDIIFQDANLPAHRMPNLYRAADCFVLPTRGEGWGRPFMEAMAMGLPVIGTNWSGNTAFMMAENSYLLDCEVVPVPEMAAQETPTYRGHRWAEPDANHLRRLMRNVFTERDSAKSVGACARADIAARFTYEPVAEIIGREINKAIQGGTPAIVSTPAPAPESESNAAPALRDVVPTMEQIQLSPEGVFGFLMEGDKRQLAERAAALPKGGLIVEIGSFMGLSSIIMSNALIAVDNLTARICCVDTWEGSVEHQELDVIRHKQLYDIFLWNIEKTGVSRFITPIRKPSVEAAKDFADGSIDLLFVDGDHSFEGCYADLVAWYPKLKPGAAFIGHDCAPDSGVLPAVEKFAREHDMTFTILPPPQAHYIFELKARKDVERDEDLLAVAPAA